MPDRSRPSRPGRTGLLLGALGTALLAAASGSPPPVAVAYPCGCEGLGLTSRRCDAIVKAAADALAIDPASAGRIRLTLGPACPTRIDDACVGSRQPFVVVRFTMPDGTSAEQPFSCYGVLRELSLLCADPPLVYTVGGVSHDIPCPGEPPDGCATPVPTIDPSARAGAAPLRVVEVAIPLTHTGRYDIALGTAILPNGVLTEAKYRLVEDRQVGYLLEESLMRLEVTRDLDGEGLGNAYDDGWVAGSIMVRVTLTFTVEAFDPGTVLHVRDIVVR